MVADILDNSKMEKKQEDVSFISKMAASILI